MSVFPAAATLTENGFDLGGLLQQPGYSDGGPNVHSLSVITWMTALVIELIGDTRGLMPVLHLIHFGIAAVAMTALFRFALPLLGVRVAVATSLAVLVFPLVLTQAGYLYLEMPILAATALAVNAWIRGDVPKTAAWSVVAVLTKGSGIITAMALAGMAFFDPRPYRRSLRTALTILLPSVTTLAVIVGLTPDRAGSSIRDHFWLLFQYLARVPDLLIILLAYLLMAVVASFRRDHNPTRTVRDDDNATRSLTIAFLIAAFFAFYLGMPFLGISSSVLPRYYILVFPFALFGLVALLRTTPERVLIGALVLLVVFFAANRDGRFYPGNDTTNFALAERSGAYATLLELQIKGIEAIGQLPADVPVFYDQPAAYKLNYPLMGYSDGPPPNGHSILHEEPFAQGALADFPEEFYMLYEHPWLGGEIIRSIRDQAEADPTRLVTIAEVTAGNLTSELIHVETVPSAEQVQR